MGLYVQSTQNRVNQEYFRYSYNSTVVKITWNKNNHFNETIYQINRRYTYPDLQLILETDPMHENKKYHYYGSSKHRVP